MRALLRTTLPTLALPALLALSCGEKSAPITPADSFEDAKRVAAERGKLIVLDFFIDG